METQSGSVFRHAMLQQMMPLRVAQRSKTGMDCSEVRPGGGGIVEFWVTEARHRS